VIWESHYWKDDLKKMAAVLRRKIHQRRWPDSSLARFEQTVTLGFYCVRKLVESKKVSDGLIHGKYPLIVFHSAGEPIHFMNWHKVDELYDLENGKDISRDLHFIYNLIIHSYVFSPFFDERGKLAGALVTSDRFKNKELYLVGIEQMIEIFDKVGRDYPGASYKWSEKRQDYEVKTFSHTVVGTEDT